MTVLLLLSCGKAVASYCWNVNGNCTTACPGAGSCFVDVECGPGGSCIFDDSICPPGSCTCQPLIGDLWYWSCQAICAGICNTDMPDSDQDGNPDVFDNCRSIWNPGQQDCDRDHVGDACDTGTGDPDGDSLCSGGDNCPYVANPVQTNADGDPDGDACDCAPADPTLFRPREITDLRVDQQPVGTRFHWSATPPAERYEMLGWWPGAPTSGQCWTSSDPDPHDTEYVEFDIPVAGELWSYLFRGVHSLCGEAPWGDAGSAPSCP